MRSQRSTASADIGLDGFANHGSMRTVLPPAVSIRMQLWPYQVIVVPAGSPMALPPLSVSMLATRLHSRRARRADRPEPGVHQLDRADGPRRGHLRSGDPPAATVHGDARLSRVR